MIHGYARVSTLAQVHGNSLEEQETAMREKGADEIVTEYYTGTTMQRQKLQELISKLKPGDTLMVTKLDRLARTAPEACTLVRNLVDKGIIVHVLNIGLVDNTPVGKLIVSTMSAFAEFERDMIIERTQSGKAIARQRPDYREGRPPKFSKKQIELALELLESNSYRAVEEMTGISVSTLVRAKRKRR